MAAGAVRCSVMATLILLLAGIAAVTAQGFRGHQNITCGSSSLMSSASANLTRFTTFCTCYITSSHAHVHLSVTDAARRRCLFHFLLNPRSSLATPTSTLVDACTRRRGDDDDDAAAAAVRRAQQPIVLDVSDKHRRFIWSENDRCSRRSDQIPPLIHITATNIFHVNCQQNEAEELILKECPVHESVIPPFPVSPITTTRDNIDREIIESKEASSSSAIIIGALVGALVVIIILIIITALLCRRYLRKRPRGSPQTCDSSPGADRTSAVQDSLLEPVPPLHAPITPVKSEPPTNIYDTPVITNYRPPPAYNTYEPTYAEISDDLADGDASLDGDDSDDGDDPYAHVGFSAAEIALAVMSNNRTAREGATDSLTPVTPLPQPDVVPVDVSSLYATSSKKQSPERRRAPQRNSVEMLDNELYNLNI